MSVEFGVWRVDSGLDALEWSPFPLESKLEDLIVEDPALLGLDVLLIGRQVETTFGKRIDLLAIDDQGELHVIELKRDKTPRDIVAQLLDYGSWAQHLGYEDVLKIWDDFSPETPFEEAFSDRFGASPPESLNDRHHLVIVASELDASTERIVDYLSESYSMLINAVFFRYFESGEQQFLMRTWLVDPTEAEARSSKSASGSAKQPWNGRDFYVSLGEGDGRRSWDDCRRYGFVSAGAGRWYSRSLRALQPGHRVFVNIPGTGYVGVGEVVAPAVRVLDFKVEHGGRSIPILEASLDATKMAEGADDPDLSEYLVRVEWERTTARDEAFWREGMFANQNSACKLRNRFTLDELLEHFKLED